MPLVTTPFDSADYLKTEEDIADYLQQCFDVAGNDSAFITRALGVAARARGMTYVSNQSGLARENLYKALSGEGNPSFATIIKVADALGVSFKAVSKHTQPAVIHAS